jgi:hypothetical protein
MEEAEIAEYGNILPEAERAYVQKRMCHAFPESRSYQECMQKIKAKKCREDPDYAHKCS